MRCLRRKDSIKSRFLRNKELKLKVDGHVLHPEPPLHKKATYVERR